MEQLTFNDLWSKLMEFRRLLIKKWAKFLLALIIGAAAGLGYFYLQPEKYVAECTFVLDEKSGSGGGLASLASSFGVDLGSMMGGSTTLFAYDNLLEILQSRRIVENVLLSEVDTAITTHQTLADLYLNFSHLKRKWQHKPGLATIHFNGFTKRESFNSLQDSVLFVIYRNVLKYNLSSDRTNKKTQIFRVTVSSASERFSKLLSERLVTEAKNFYINIKTSTTQNNIERLQKKADSLLALLNDKSYQTAEAQILNANTAIKTVALPGKLAVRNETIIATLYTEVVKNLEVTKTTQMMQTPVILVLDYPKYPLEDMRKKILLLSVASAMIFVLMYGLYLFFKFFLTDKKGKNTSAL